MTLPLHKENVQYMGKFRTLTFILVCFFTGGLTFKFKIQITDELISFTFTFTKRCRNLNKTGAQLFQ